MSLELETFDDGRPRRKRARKVRDLGGLHALLIRGLPDWTDDNGMLMTYDLAEYLGVSYQAMYKIYDRNRIPQKRINALIKLSAESKKGDEFFTPLTHEDFAEFLG